MGWFLLLLKRGLTLSKLASQLHHLLSQSSEAWDDLHHYHIQLEIIICLLSIYLLTCLNFFIWIHFYGDGLCLLFKPLESMIPLLRYHTINLYMQENTNLQGHKRVKLVLCVHFQYISNNRVLGFKKAWRAVMLTGMGTKGVTCVFIVKWLVFQLLSCWLHTSLPSVDR